MSTGKALIRPPKLTTGREGGASRLELFFDLAYVLVVIELAATFVKDLSWAGFGAFTGLFAALWFSWIGFTLYANRFDTDDVVFRVGKLAATLAIAGCAAAASGAPSDYAVPFAACYLLGRVILLLMYVRAWRHIPDARPTITVYLGTIGVSAALWAASIPVSGATRFVLWGVGVAVGAVGPLLANTGGKTLPLHIEHLPERFGLLVILVLGETVGGAATGVHDASWAPASVLVGVAGFIVAAAMWWIYFDHTSATSADQLSDNDEEPEAAPGADDDDAGGEPSAPAGDGSDTDQRHDLFLYGHLPLTLGATLAGVGIEHLVTHPDETLPSPAGWILAGGVAVFLLGAVAVIGGTHRTWRSVWPWPLAVVPLALAAAFIPHTSGLLAVSVQAALLALLAITGALGYHHGVKGQDRQ